MKYNKSNIITDEDIILKDFDATLGETLQKQQDEINSLKSNVKWMYKYGALGSGAGGSGSGSTSSFRVLVYRDNTSVIRSGSTLYYAQPGSQTITVQIMGGGTSSYTIEYTYDEDKKTTDTVSANSGFKSTKTLLFPKNSTLNIVVTQDTGEVYTENGSPVLSFPYIVSAYKFDSYYVRGYQTDTTEELDRFSLYDNSIFMSEIQDGVMLALKYNIAIDIETTATKLYYDDFNGNRITFTGEDTRITKGDGILYFKLDDNIIQYLQNNNNATYKNVEIGLQITLKNSVEPEKWYKNNLSVDLIPSGLYLKVSSTGGRLTQLTQNNQDTIFDTVNNFDNTLKFNPGDLIFTIVPYNGSKNKNRQYNVRIDIYDISDAGEITATPSHTIQNIQPIDQEYTNVSVPCGNGGVKKIVFTLTLLSETKTFEYYINVKIFESNFNWYPKNISPVANSYYRYALDTKNISEISTNTLIEKNINSEITTLRFDNDSILYATGAENINDVLLNLGIQYSKSNDYDTPILSFNAKDSTSTEIAENSIFVYQNKIVITGGISRISNGRVTVGTADATIKIFIPLVDILNSVNKENYHLLSIYKRLEVVERANYWRGIYAFIDGVLDGASGNFLSTNHVFESITFYPANYKINLIDKSYWNHNTSNNTRLYLEDNDIVGFWYTYNERMRSLTGEHIYDDDHTALFEYFSSDNFKYDDENNIIYTDESLPGNIAEHLNIPTLLIKFDDDKGNIGMGYVGWGKDNLKEFIDGRFDEEQDVPEKIPVKIEYAEPKHPLQPIKLPDTDRDATFYLDLQGSSTRSFKCKNFELHAPEYTADANHVYVYSPNNDPDVNNVDAFLPETSFTLKADVVDSSHTNNNAIGAFVDANTTQFYDAGAAQNSAYNARLKNCLTGFPVLVFLHTTFYTDENKQQVIPRNYFLGIYNFNLGRHSAFNMGYKHISNLDKYLVNSSKGFQLFKIADEDNEYLPNIEVAEIQGNNKHFDFSQYNESVLFKLTSVANDKTYMWGDFVNNTSVINDNKLRTNIQKFVKSIAESGGYIFSRLQKVFSNDPADNYGYDYTYSGNITYRIDSDGDRVPLISVPNFRWQYSRYVENGTLKQKYTDSNVIIENLANILYQTILQYDDEDSNTTNIPAVDFRSLAEYYTVCMAFALVDNVMKNMNIKSWNEGDKKRWYIAFYDMDCGAGENNAGMDISYFAFSDYWDSKITKDDKGNNILSEVEIYRDWAPSHDNSTSEFFDVPSSYLFAIAKYAYTILKNITTGDIAQAIRETILPNDPSNIWGRWRNANGPLRNARYVIETYFKHHLDNVPEFVFNLNYRYKYFVKTYGENDTFVTSFDARDFGKFHGRRMAYKEYWLDGRLHILDAYFNLAQFDTLLKPSNYSAPSVLGAYQPKNNSDVYLLNDIFYKGTSLVGNQYAENSAGSLFVTARPLSPLFINGANFSSLYLFPKESVPCRISINISGLQTVMFGGSAMWTDISSVNQFVTANNALTIDSNYLQNIIGTERICTFTTNDLNVPAVKNIILKSENYSGSLDINTSGENQYHNLTEIDISYSKLNLQLDSVPLKRLTATNKPGGKLIMTNLKLIDSVNINGNFDELTLNTWSSNCNVGATGAVNCPIVSVTNFTDRFPNGEITISNNQLLHTLTLTGFTSINIEGCPKLTKIQLVNCENLRNLQVSMPVSNYKTEQMLTIDTGFGDDINAGVVDLSRFSKLSSISFKNCNINEINIGDNKNIELPARAFENCTELQHIYTGENTKLYITDSSTFQNCYSLNYHYSGDDENTIYMPLHVKEGTTALDYTFSCYGSQRGNLTFEDAKHFFDTIVDDIDTNVVMINGVERRRPTTRFVKSYRDMFRNQNINYSLEQGIQEYNNNTCSFKFGLFLSATSLMDNALTDNNIEFINRYMFTTLHETGFDGKYRIGINNTSGVGGQVLINIASFGNVFTTIDVFKDIIGHCAVFNAPSTIFTIVDNMGNNLSEIKLNDMFTPSDRADNLISTISDFNVSSSFVNNGVGRNIIFDFSELFNSPKYDNETHTIVKNSSDNVEYGNVWAGASNELTIYKFMPGTYYVDSWENVNHLLSNCKLGKTIYDSFGGFISRNETRALYRDALDIYNFINWDNLTNLNNVEILFHSTELYSGAMAHGRTSGLSMKKFVTYENMQKIVKTLLQMNKLKYVGALFNNCVVLHDSVNSNFKFIEDTDIVENNTIESIGGLFANMKLSTNDTLTDNKPIIINHDLMKPFKNVISFVGTFENWYLKYPLPFDFFNKRNVDNVEQIMASATDIDGNAITNVYRHTFTYRKDIIDVLDCFKNIRFATLSSFKISGIYDDTNFDVNLLPADLHESKNRFSWTLNGEVYSGDSIKINNELNTVEESTEITDAELAEQINYSLDNYNDENNELHLGNMLMSNVNATKIDATGCFITPDILYAMRAEAYFDDLCTRSISYRDEMVYTFTGTIPQHMMKNLMNRRFSNLFTGLNITPIHRADFDAIEPAYKHYVFVPDNFSNAEDFSNSFNFNMLLPRNVEGYNDFFMLLSDKSLPNMTCLENAVYTQRLDCKDKLLTGANTLADVHINDYNIRYNIMGGINTVDGTQNITYGINALKYRNMRYDNILNSVQAFIYYGNVILNDDNGWSKTKLFNSASSLYPITSLQQEFYNVMKISKNIRLTATVSNDNYFSISPTIDTYVNKSSLILCNNTSDWIGTDNAYGTHFYIVDSTSSSASVETNG